MTTFANQNNHDAVPRPYGSVLTALAGIDAGRFALVCDAPGCSDQFTRRDLEDWDNRLARRQALGERLHAIVDVGSATSTLNEAVIRQYLCEQLVHYKISPTLEIVTTLLRDDADKMRRSALRAARLR